MQDAKMSPKIAIWAPSHNFAGLYLVTNGWDPSGSLRHPCKFQRVSRLGSVTARHSSSGRQPDFASLNRGRHLCSAGRPSRWALAHILVKIFVAYSKDTYKNIVNTSAYGLQRSRFLLARINLSYDIVHQKALCAVQSLNWGSRYKWHSVAKIFCCVYCLYGHVYRHHHDVYIDSFLFIVKSINLLFSVCLLPDVVTFWCNKDFQNGV